MLYIAKETIVYQGAIKSEGSFVEMSEGEALAFQGKLSIAHQETPETATPEEPETVSTMLEAETPKEPVKNTRKIRGFRHRKVK